MRRVRGSITKDQRRVAGAVQTAIPLDEGTVTTPASIAMIQALIPLGLKAVEESLLAEVTELAGRRYARADGRAGVVRWGKQRGSIYLADQKVAITVPRVRDRVAGCERSLATYTRLQTPRTHDVGLFRRVLGGISCREYEAAAEAVPEAFGLARSSVSRRFKTVRSYSFFGFSTIYIIFDEHVDFYWSRSRVLEKLASLPPESQFATLI